VRHRRNRRPGRRRDAADAPQLAHQRRADRFAARDAWIAAQKNLGDGASPLVSGCGQPSVSSVFQSSAKLALDPVFCRTGPRA
jgi:hypothetical protein